MTDPIIGIFTELLDRFGLLAALMAFAGFNYVLIARRSRKAEASALEAQTAQQTAITEQFTAQAAENRRLQNEVNAVNLEFASMRTALRDAETARKALQDELAATKKTAEAAQAAHQASAEKAAGLARELTDLRQKVLTLETERAVRTDELKRETERALKLEREVTDLRARVARLEGENNALHKVIDKLNVVSVHPSPHDPSDPTDPPPRVLPLTREDAA